MLHAINVGNALKHVSHTSHSVKLHTLGYVSIGKQVYNKNTGLTGGCRAVQKLRLLGFFNA